MLRAALFDWDGVIVDSSAAHKESWEMLARERGLPLPPNHFARSFGRKNAVIIPEIYKWSQDPAEIEELGKAKEHLYLKLLGEWGLEALPGVETLLRALNAAGIPCAVGTSTPKSNIDYALDALGFHDHFQILVTAEDVTHGKPDPEVFLKGAAALGVDPADAVVFEDAVYGIDAALAGGMKAVAVTTSHPREKFARAHLVVDSLEELDVDRLRGLWD
jgi:HAD superfamily hydrolase (TIGR01509 family)